MASDQIATETLSMLVKRVIGGGTPSRSVASFWNGDISWASVKDFSDDSIDLIRTVESITPMGLSASATNLIDAGTPIVCTRMAVGRCAAPVDSVAINQDLKALVPDDHVHSRFLLYALKRLQPIFESQAVGSTVKGITLRQLLSVPIEVPPLSEQRRIAEILDTLNEAIRKTEQVIAKLQQMKQGLLHDLLTRGIDENGELRDPERHPEQFKESKLERIPTVWDVCPFARYSRPDRPFLKTGPFGSSLKGEHWVEEGVPVITIGALGEGEFIKSELLFVSEKKASELTSYVVEQGDIVFSRVADVGRSVVVDKQQTGWIMSSNLMWISLDPTQVHPDYVWLNLSSNPLLRQQIRQSVNAGGREVANGAILRSLVIAWPDISEQIQIVNGAKKLHQQLLCERSELDKLRILKHGLMEDLLTGRVRVTVPVERAS